MAKSIEFNDSMKDIVCGLKTILESLREVPILLDDGLISEAGFVIGSCRQSIHYITTNIENEYLGDNSGKEDFKNR